MSTPKPRDPLPYVAAACAANAVSFIVPNSSPFAIGGLVEGFPLSESGAGLVLSCEILAMGLAGLGISPFMARVPRSRLAMASTFVIILANAAAILAGGSGFTTLLALRILAGLGAGALLATANAAIAGARSPPGLYGMALMTSWLLAAALGPVLAGATEAFAYNGVYGVLLILAVMSLPLLGGIGRMTISAEAGIALPRSSIRAGVVHIAGIVLVGVSMMAYFAFVERLGQRAGMPLSGIGILFSCMAVLGAVGAGVAGWAGSRFGLIMPLAAGTALHAVAVIVAVLAESQALFAAGAVAESLTFMYLLTYQFALAAKLDAHGRWAAAASGALLGSTGAGPYLGGGLIMGFGYAALAWLVILCTIPALIAILVVRRSMGDRAAGP